jgi:hypothetical protein
VKMQLTLQLFYLPGRVGRLFKRLIFNLLKLSRWKEGLNGGWWDWPNSIYESK